MHLFPITQQPTREDTVGGYINIVFSYNDENIVMQETWCNHRWMSGDFSEEDKQKKIRVLGWIPANKSINFAKWFNAHLFGISEINTTPAESTKRRIRINEN